MTLPQLGLSGARCILAGVVSTRDRSAPQRLDDLEAQLCAAGATVVARVVQRRGVSRTRAGRGFKNSPDVISPATLLGSGKTQELVDAVTAHHATLVVFLNSLRAGQAARLAELTGCEIISADSAA
jgi:50S ribosomal subunit-associated GTPase HflX